MISANYNDIKKHLMSMRLKTYEPGYDVYSKILPRLNEICCKSGDSLEGNLYYSGQMDFSEKFDVAPKDRFRGKRRDYSTYVLTGSNLLEVGFNGGHSALLALSVNVNLKYTGVDFGNHPYTKPAFEFLKNIFGDRIDLILGDSRDILPQLAVSSKKYDLFHVAGGHDYNVAFSDLSNVWNISNHGDVVLFDDTNSGVASWYLDEICDFFVATGKFSKIELAILWESNQHILLRVNK